VKSGGALKGTRFGMTAPSETAKKSLSKRLRGAAHEGRKSRAVRKKNAPNAAVNQRRLVMTDALFDAGTVAADAPWSWVLRNTAVGDGVATRETLIYSGAEPRSFRLTYDEAMLRQVPCSRTLLLFSSRTERRKRMPRK
jgi:hypothetical protein